MDRNWIERHILLIGIVVLALLFSVLQRPAEADPIELMRTGQTATFAAGDDGSLQAGVPWPSPRFMVSVDQTVTDNLTGLVWSKDAGMPTITGSTLCTGGSSTWQSALDYVSCLNANNHLGHNDWRLPNVVELESIINISDPFPAAWLMGQGFTNAQTESHYWTSTTLDTDSTQAVIVDGTYGYFVIRWIEKTDSGLAWPVRGTATGPAKLRQTGQTATYSPGDDGTLQTGTAWPIPRFIDNGDGTVTDKLTGFMWTKSATTPMPLECSSLFGSLISWVDAFSYITCLNTNNYLGHNDWKLPNREELFSLSSTLSLPIEHPFINVPLNHTFSSTTMASYPDVVWGRHASQGNLIVFGKSSTTYVWPMRDLNWRVYSVSASDPCMDWRTDQHGTVTPGGYVRIAGVYYYVMNSWDQTWSGTNYTGACLYVTDQASGQANGNADLHGMEGLMIAYFPAWPIPSHCSNGIQDADETGLDCGGNACAPCGPPTHCKNGIRDLDETGIDCGGSCGPCEICGDGIDNNGNGVIDEGCFVSHCFNKQKDYDETGVDCGGSCGACSPPPDATCAQPVHSGSTQQRESSINASGEVVWSQYDSITGYYQIFSTTSGTVTNDAYDHFSPHISNLGDVVWTQYDRVSPSTSIYGRISGQVVRITDGPQDSNPTIIDSGEVLYNKYVGTQREVHSTTRGYLLSLGEEPDMNNNGDIVYANYDWNTLSVQVYLLSKGSYTPIAVTSGSSNHRSPAINDYGEIVWAESTDYANRNIYSNVRGQLTFGSPAESITDLDLNNGGDIVFSTTDWMPRGYGVVYRLSANAPCVAPPPPGGTCGQAGSPVAVSPGSLQQYQSSVNSLGEVVWSQYDPVTGQTQIYSSVSGTVTSDTTNHSNPSINNYGDIVWEQDSAVWGRISGQVIWLASGSQPSINDAGEVVYVQYDGISAKIYSTLRGQLTSDGATHNHPDINNHGDVVWDQDGQIYKLAAGTDAPVIVPTVNWGMRSQPSINDSGAIVWSQWDRSKATIYSNTSGTVTQVTTNCPAGNHMRPDINSCGDIVFTAENAGFWTIYRLGNSAPCMAPPPPGGTCGQANSPVAVTTGTTAMQYGSINALGEVVWSQLDPGTGYSQIFSSVSGTVTSDTTNHSNPSINNYGDIVWEQDSAVWGRISGQVIWLASGSQPSINDAGEVVYVQYDGISAKIYSTLRGQLTSDGATHNHPDINNHGDVVWDQDGQIYKLAAGTDTPVIVPTNPGWHSQPSINDSGVIVWSQWDRGKSTIYSSASGTVTQVTTNCPAGNHMRPDINACGDIVFTVENAGIWAVYRLGNSAPCMAPPPPGGTCGQAGSPVVVAPGSTQQGGSSINALGEVVWSQFDPVMGQNQIYSSFSGTVTSDTTSHSNPSINNYGDIVWQQDSAVWGRISGQVIWLASGSQPSINDTGEVVYVQYDGISAKIYSTLRGQLTSDSATHNHPDINNHGDVVWDQDGQIYKLAAGTDTPVIVPTANWGIHSQPSINDSGVIVWSQWDRGKSTIYSSASGTVTQVTTNCPAGNHMRPDINACGDIVFTVENAGIWAVYRLGNSAPCATFPPASGVTLTASPAGVHLVGTTVTFTAQASGERSIYEYKFLRKGPVSTKYAIVQNYAALNTLTWDTAGATPGTYTIEVLARSVGSTAKYEAYKTLTYTLVANAPVSSVTLTANVPSPHVIGTPVTFTAAATGSTGTVMYKFLRKAAGSTGYTTMQDYSTANTLEWDPAPIDVGTHTILVYARNNGSTAAFEASKTLSYKLVNSPVASVTLAASAPSPHVIGTPVTFTATATGGTGTAMYKFYRKAPGSSVYTVVQEYSDANTLEWDPAPTDVGTHTILVYARNNGATANYEASKTLSYTLLANAPVTSVTLTADKTSPQPAGSSITFTALATGTTNSYEYSFIMKKSTDAAWSTPQGWSGMNTFVWTPADAGSYTIQVRARNIGSSSAYEAFKSKTFSITQ